MDTNLISGYQTLDSRLYTLDTGLTPLDSGLGVDSLDYCHVDSGLRTLDMGLSGIFNPSPVMVGSILINLLKYTKIVMYTRVLSWELLNGGYRD